MEQAAALLLMAMAVAVLPWLARLARMPAPVAEIIFGVILGKSLLHMQFKGEWLPFLGELGFLVLMFHAGMEIDFRMLARQGRQNLVIQLALFGLTLGLALAAALLLGKGVFVALVLTTTSLSLVVPALREAGLSGTAYAQSVLVAATLADFLTLLGITLVVLWRTAGIGWHFFQPLGLFAAFAAALWGMRLWAWWHPKTAEKLFLGSDAQELGVRLSLALLFIFVGLSELAGLEPVLGAFMGGCIISFVLREKGVLESKISAIGFGFLVPLFFIHVGMGFDISNILSPEMLAFTGLLLLCALAVKLGPSLLFYLQGYCLRRTLSAGLLLSSRLSLIVAAAAIGVREGFISVQMRDAIIFLALVTCLLGPVCFRLFMRPPRDF